VFDQANFAGLMLEVMHLSSVSPVAIDFLPLSSKQSAKDLQEFLVPNRDLHERAGRRGRNPSIGDLGSVSPGIVSREVTSILA
jgi:hypothetical protein